MLDEMLYSKDQSIRVECSAMGMLEGAVVGRISDPSTWVYDLGPGVRVSSRLAELGIVLP